MRFANNILENNCYAPKINKVYGQLSGMKKLLAKGENGTFWAKDFDIEGCEMVGLANLDCIKPTGKTVEVDIVLATYADGRKTVKTVEVKEWELIDYERLAKAYEMIMGLLNM